MASYTRIACLLCRRHRGDHNQYPVSITLKISGETKSAIQELAIQKETTVAELVRSWLNEKVQTEKGTE